MKVFLLGAGASKAYSDSKSGLRMPVARDFFQTFQKLPIYNNPWALREALFGYIEKEKRIDPEEYLSSGIDIEELHSEIQDKLLNNIESEDKFEKIIRLRPFNELIFIFASVINAIQNGPSSKAHKNIARALGPNDAIITFNWDTLLDRALFDETEWRPDFGYGFSPRKVFRDTWTSPDKISDDRYPLIIKLHGSTNWITSHPILDENGSSVLIQESDPDTVYVYERTNGPFDTYDGRYMGGFEPFSYGYYPPNILDDKGRKPPKGYMIGMVKQRVPWKPKGEAGSLGLPSMPLIIPPVKQKSYDFFGDLFRDLWEKAGELLVNAEHIIVIGYSFPKTDVKSNDLFIGSFMKRKTMPKITIIDPFAESIVDKFKYEYGIAEDHLTVYKEYFTEEFSLKDLG